MKILCIVFFLILSSCMSSKDYSKGYVELLSVHRTVDGKDIWEKPLRNQIIPYISKYGGNSFIDERGYPVTGEYDKVKLTLQEAESFKEGIYVESAEGTACEPVYRNAIIYYNGKGEPLSWVLICFECGKTFQYPGSRVLDSKTIRIEKVFHKHNLETKVLNNRP